MYVNIGDLSFSIWFHCIVNMIYAEMFLIDDIA